MQKLFLHLYEENPFEIDAHAPLSFFDGRDAYQVARRAFTKHESQQIYGFAVQRDNGQYAFNRFGMAEGVVPLGDDVFDNIDETLLSSYVPPTSEPTAVPTDTPVPKDTPTPTDTPEPTEAPTPVSTPEPEPVRQTEKRYLVLGIGAAVIAAVVAVGFAIGRKKR